MDQIKNNPKDIFVKLDSLLTMKNKLEEYALQLFGYPIKFYIVQNNGEISKNTYLQFCQEFNITNRSKKKEEVKLRHCFIFLLMNEPYKLSSTQLGRMMGYDHSTILHAQKAINDDLSVCPERVESTIFKIRIFLQKQITN